MRTHAQLPFLLLCLTASSLPAQRAITTVYGTTSEGRLGTIARVIGDFDGDGVLDFVLSEPTNSTTAPGAVYVISGRTRATLQTLRGIVSTNVDRFGGREVAALRDVDGDSTMDFAVAYGSGTVTDVFSGATGTRLYRLGPTSRYTGPICDVGDVDNDGRTDMVAAVEVNSRIQLWIVDGRDGVRLAVIETSETTSGVLRNVGDLDGDGRDEVVVCTHSRIDVYDLARGIRRARISVPDPSSELRTVEVLDWNEDGKNDVLLSGPPVGRTRRFLSVFSATNGALLTSFTVPLDDTGTPPGTFTVMPDVDGDGVRDLLTVGTFDPMLPGPVGLLTVVSGRTRERLMVWAGSAQFDVVDGRLLSLGDLDGDGFGDFATANPNVAEGRGGYQVVSGRPLAAMRLIPTNCYHGLFAPELGVTRPVLGSRWQIGGRSVPLGTSCVVVAGLGTPVATNAGVVGCDLWFDVGNWFVLAQPTSTPTWQIGVPLPDVRQLVGVELALQAFHFPTDSPIRADLTNGVRVRLGY